MFSNDELMLFYFKKTTSFFFFFSKDHVSYKKSNVVVQKAPIKHICKEKEGRDVPYKI